MHDAFVRALRHRRTFRGHGSREGWLFRIVVNEACRRRAAEERTARSRGSSPLDEALERYERKGNVVMTERTRARLDESV